MFMKLFDLLRSLCSLLRSLWRMSASGQVGETSWVLPRKAGRASAHVWTAERQMDLSAAERRAPWLVG
jgi:hypothetical protein